MITNHISSLLQLSYVMSGYRFFVCPVEFNNDSNSFTVDCEPSELFQLQDYGLPPVLQSITGWVKHTHSHRHHLLDTHSSCLSLGVSTPSLSPFVILLIFVSVFTSYSYTAICWLPTCCESVTAPLDSVLLMTTFLDHHFWAKAESWIK